MGMKILRTILPFLVVILLCAVVLHAFGVMETRLGPLDVEMRMRFDPVGETRIVLPPVGQVKASTHRWPVVFSVRLNRIDMDGLKAELGNVERPNDYLKTIIPGLRKAFWMFLFYLLLLGTVTGAFSGMIIWGWRDYRRWGLALLTGLVFTAFVLGGAAVGYDQSAFDNPRYEGILEAAPWLLDLVDQGLAHLDLLGQKMAVMAGNLNRLFNQVDQLDPLAKAEGELKVIHVSDIHNNPAAFDFLSRVVQGFGADLIVDTGDLTDYGTPIEAQLGSRISGLKVPYYFVPGNHDSPEVVARLRAIPGLKVLDGNTVTYKGLTILGWGDPAAKTGRLVASEKELVDSANALANHWEALQVKPDLVAVHNAAYANRLLGSIPLLLHGHDHRSRIYEAGTTRIIDAGTTGAAGVRALENKSKDGVPFSLALLRFDRTNSNGPYTLTAVDTIRVYSLNGRFILERKVVKGGEGIEALSGGLAQPGTPTGDP